MAGLSRRTTSGNDHPANRQTLTEYYNGVNKPDGTLTWISINTEPLYYSDQRVTPDAVVVSFIDITQKKTAEIELQWNERQLREYSERINNILDSITDGFIAVDNEMKVILWNKVFENSTHIRSIEAMGREVIEIFPDVKGHVYDQFLEALRLKKTIVQEYYSSTHKIWFETTAFPSAQGLFLYFRDISKRKRQESLLALEKEVLELNAHPDASLKTTTDFLLLGMEKIFPGILCSVLSLQEDAQTIETLSAPSIPQSYNEAINGLKIGPKIGSCGAAMYHKKNVIVEDIATHEYWELFKELALHYGFASCWSFPILSSHNIVLASFAIYGIEVKSPSAEELLIIERAVNILRLIIESKQSEEKIKVSNERYLLATMATNDAIWDWDIPTNSMYWGEGFHGLFGYKAGYFNSDLGIWEAALHPQDRDRVIKSIQKFIESNSQQVWQDEYRFRRTDGKYVLVADRGFLIYNQQGRVNRMVGSMQDITEKREMEKKLLNQELNRQKLTAQAVVDAQEKERSLIGKELHDNINQILSTAKLYLEVARNDDKERTSLIDMSTNSISDAINEIRTISRSLVPSSIGDLGLVESIQDLVESIKLTRKLNVEFYYHNGIDELMSEQLKLMLFRITQEQVNNVIKHANATNLVIELISEDDTINIAITDNGQGFDPDQVKFKKGVGLSNITSRAELFNGKVTIDTAPGKGCTLNIHLPISIL
jgi:PAS domain S-box-containing protein